MTNKSKRSRPSSEIGEQPRKHIANQGLPLFENDIRFDGLDYFQSINTESICAKYMDVKIE